MKQIAMSLALSAGLAGLAMAQDKHPAVVELYTSQGCSSCPPADALFAELAQRPDVIGLALHVDYWDYIGWTDTFASPEFTNRQYAYARFAGEKMVYTPQMVVNGRQSIEGTDREAVRTLIMAGAKGEAPTLKIGRTGDRLSIRATASGALPRGAEVALVRIIPQASVAISRGENAGRTLVYTNVVTSWQQVGQWDGAAPLDLTVDVPGQAGVVVLLQEPGPGAILAAAALR